MTSPIADDEFATRETARSARGQAISTSMLLRQRQPSAWGDARRPGHDDWPCGYRTGANNASGAAVVTRGRPLRIAMSCGLSKTPRHKMCGAPAPLLGQVMYPLACAVRTNQTVGLVGDRRPQSEAPPSKSISHSAMRSLHRCSWATSRCVLCFEVVGGAFTDDDAGRHRVSRGDAGHDRPVSDAKALCPIDFQRAVDH
jgi:hypothetical protein